MRKACVAIDYCPRCHWLARAAWLAQELLGSFTEELAEVALRPAVEGGTFDIYVDNVLLWSRKQQGRFPDIVELKQSLRDRIAPHKSLGHSDRPKQSP